MAYTQKQIKDMIDDKLLSNFGLSPEDADEEHIYKALALSVRDLLQQSCSKFSREQTKKDGLYFDEGRDYMTAEVNACAEACLEIF